MNESFHKKIDLNDLDELWQTLEQYLHRAMRAFTTDRLSLSQIKELTASVEEIRQLLQELDRCLCPPGGDAHRKPSISELRNAYLELEGMAKEIRNDRCDAASMSRNYFVR